MRKDKKGIIIFGNVDVGDLLCITQRPVGTIVFAQLDKKNWEKCPTAMYYTANIHVVM